MKKNVILIASVLLASCSSNELNHDVMSDAPDVMMISLSPEEAISVSFDDSTILSMDEAVKIAERFMNDENRSRATSDNPVIAVESSFVKSLEYGSTISRSHKSQDVLFYELSVKQNDESGYVVLCADTRYPEVLSYVECGSLDAIKGTPAEIMHNRSMDVALNYIRKCNEFKELYRTNTIEKICKQFNIDEEQFSLDKFRERIYIKPLYGEDIQSRSTVTVTDSLTGMVLTQVGPLCGTTQLIQGWPCNQFIQTTDLEKYNTEQHNGHFPAGCANVALATMCSYIQPTVYSSDLGRNINWSNVANAYFNPFAWFTPSAYNPDSESAIETAYVLKIFADGTKTEFDEDGGGTTLANASSYMKSIGVNMGTSKVTLNYSNVRSSLMSLGLIYAVGELTELSRSSESLGNHAWVIDGLQIRTKMTRAELQNYNCYVSCKFGWIEPDPNNTWYTSTPFNGWYLCDTDGTISFEFTDSQNQLSSNLKCIINIK